MLIGRLLDKITELHVVLTEANGSFLSSEISREALLELIDQREKLLRDIWYLFDQLVKAIKKEYIDQPFEYNNIADIALALPILNPEHDKACQKFKKVLSDLVHSDTRVEQAVQKGLHEFKNEINKLRRSSKSLNGYKQGSQLPATSAFIDKKK